MSPPLDHSAVEAANKALFADHPELKGRALTGSAADAGLRKEWKQLYAGALLKKTKPPAPKTHPKPSSAGSPPIGPVANCPLGSSGKSFGAPSSALDTTLGSTGLLEGLQVGANLASQIASEGVRAVISLEAASSAYKAGLTVETAISHGNAVAAASPIVRGLGLFGAVMSFFEAAQDTREVLGTSNYQEKVSAASKTFGALAFAAGSFAGGALASWVLAYLGVTGVTAGLVAASVTAPAWGPIVVAGVVIVGVGLAGGYAAKAAWDNFGDKWLRKAYPT